MASARRRCDQSAHVFVPLLGLCVFTTSSSVCVQDCARYLLALEPCLNAVYGELTSDSIATVIGQMDGIVTALGNAVTTSRCFAQPHRAAVLFQQLSNKLAGVCIEYVAQLIPGRHNDSAFAALSHPSLWDADFATVVARVESCKQLHSRFHGSYLATKSTMQSDPLGPQLVFAPQKVFHRFNAVITRLTGIAHIMTSVLNIEHLRHTPIHGTQLLSQHMAAVLAILRRRKYDALAVTHDDPGSAAGASTMEPSESMQTFDLARFDSAHVSRSTSPGIDALFTAVKPRALSPFEHPSSIHTGDVKLELFTPVSRIGGLDWPLDSRTRTAVTADLSVPLSAAAPPSRRTVVSRQPSLRATRHLRPATANPAGTPPGMNRCALAVGFPLTAFP